MILNGKNTPLLTEIYQNSVNKIRPKTVYITAVVQLSID